MFIISILFTIITYLYIIGCISLIMIVLSQKKRSSGINAVSQMGAPTYWDRNKGRSIEGKLERYTIIGGALLFIFSLILSIIK